MKIKRFIGGSLESNGYVIYHYVGSMCFIIDPGYNPKRFIDFTRENKLTCEGIILTHLHHDHVGAADAISTSLNAKIMMGEKDAFVYKGRVDRPLSNGEILEFEGERLEIINTPGHTKGSISIMCEKSRVCFTGDTIFDTDLGRSDLAGGSEEDMRNTVVNIIDKWDNDIFIYPGHDEGCNMKTIRKINTEFINLIEGGSR